MKKITFLLSFLICSAGFSQSVAKYTITFTNYWNPTDHNNGNPFPGNPHWSDLVGVNHNSDVTFLELGGMATKGVENIAEIGNQTMFETVDVQNAINSGFAEQFFNAGDLFLSSSSNTIVYNGLEVSDNYPLLTMLSMIAPSPDWMIAINSINLRENNSWKPSISMDLFPYDAGTENGSTYSLSNTATVPQGSITNISGVAPFNNEKVAHLSITLESVLSINETTGLKNIKIFPNPSSQTITISNINNIDLSSVEIYNVLGTLVKQIPVAQKQTALNINITSLSKGIYLLKLQDKKGNSNTERLIIN